MNCRVPAASAGCAISIGAADAVSDKHSSAALRNFILSSPRRCIQASAWLRRARRHFPHAYFSTEPRASIVIIPGAWFADRKSVVYGKSVSVRVDLGGRRIIKKKKKRQNS